MSAYSLKRLGRSRVAIERYSLEKATGLFWLNQHQKIHNNQIVLYSIDRKSVNTLTCVLKLVDFESGKPHIAG